MANNKKKAGRPAKTKAEVVETAVVEVASSEGEMASVETTAEVVETEDVAVTVEASAAPVKAAKTPKGVKVIANYEAGPALQVGTKITLWGVKFDGVESNTKDVIDLVAYVAAALAENLKGARRAR